MKFAGTVGRAALFCWEVQTTSDRRCCTPAKHLDAPSGAARDQLIDGRDGL
jgi:hypothetical protein